MTATVFASMIANYLVTFDRHRVTQIGDEDFFRQEGRDSHNEEAEGGSDK